MSSLNGTMILIYKYVLLHKLIWLTKQVDGLTEVKWERGAFHEFTIFYIIDRWTLGWTCKISQEGETGLTSKYHIFCLSISLFVSLVKCVKSLFSTYFLHLFGPSQVKTSETVYSVSWIWNCLFWKRQATGLLFTTDSDQGAQKCVF